MEKIKKWFTNLSGATKFMFILCVLFTVTNILLIVIFGLKSDETLTIINSSHFSSERSELFSMFGLSDLFDGLKQTIKSVVLIIFNILGYYISYVIGKFFGFFKSITEMLTDIQDDGGVYLLILLYNVISLCFDILTISSFLAI